MELENVIYKLQRGLQNRINQLSLSITTSGVDNMETYKYIIGQIHALESVKQELSSLKIRSKMKEQSSTSENPKLRPALQEKYKEETEKLPKPTGWRIIVLPFRMDEKTKGGILVGQDTLDKQQVASQCGNVLAMGSQCYKDKERYPDGPWCKKGDWVIFARYAGSRIQIEGGEIRLLNEDEILATVKNPEDILHKF